jgi:hypothetical protein
MSTETDVTGPRISSYMNLEQAMREVRAYLDKKNRQVVTTADNAMLPAGQLSLQSAFIAQLGNIATRLGQVEPNSKLGPPGVFLKRMVRKAIGWYSRPAHEFDRTAVETFHQIRRDMLQLQQQIVALNQRMGEASRTPERTSAQVGPASATPMTANQNDLQRSMLMMFRVMIGTRAVRQALQDENPGLLQKVEGLLETMDAQLRDDPQVPEAKVRT